MSTLFWLTMIKNKLGHKLKGMSYCESLGCLRFIMGCDKEEIRVFIFSVWEIKLLCLVKFFCLVAYL